MSATTVLIFIALVLGIGAIISYPIIWLTTGRKTRLYQWNARRLTVYAGFDDRWLMIDGVIAAREKGSFFRSYKFEVPLDGAQISVIINPGFIGNKIRVSVGDEILLPV
jgi:hypothetical protein